MIRPHRLIFVSNVHVAKDIAKKVGQLCLNVVPNLLPHNWYFNLYRKKGKSRIDWYCMRNAYKTALCGSIDVNAWKKKIYLASIILATLNTSIGVRKKRISIGLCGVLVYLFIFCWKQDVWNQKTSTPNNYRF